MAKDMEKPSAQYPLTPTSTPSPMPVHIPDFSLRGESWDQLVKNRGIRFIHRSMAPCPNMKTVFDNSHNPNCPICDGQGMFTYKEKEVVGVFYSNSIEKNFEMQGIWETGTAFVTLPTEYDDGTQAEFAPWDQLVITDFTVRLYEIKEYEPRPSGTQQLRYPIHNIDYIASAINDELNEFIEGTDFEIFEGKIKWLQPPTYDSANQRGDVFVVQYFANPVYNVMQHMRELRVSQQMVAGQKVARRLPQQVLVRRDYLNNPAEKEASTEL